MSILNTEKGLPPTVKDIDAAVAVDTSMDCEIPSGPAAKKQFKALCLAAKAQRGLESTMLDMLVLSYAFQRMSNLENVFVESTWSQYWNRHAKSLTKARADCATGPIRCWMTFLMTRTEI